MSMCSLSSWKPELRSEPHIRVGMVLPEDGMRELRVDIPQRPYELVVDGNNMGRLPAGPLELAVQDSAVVLRAAGVARKGEVIRLVPIDPPAPQQGSGAVLRQVVTGRGFHWQKRVDFSLEGVLEFRACDGFVLGVDEIGLEDYLQGVITAEMSGRCPLEFLKSQCVVARSWVLAGTEPKHRELPIDRCNDDCCQRYHGTSYLTPRAGEAVLATRGQAVCDAQGRIIDANYSKSCGGIIEAPENVWFTSKTCQRAAPDAPADSPARRFMPIGEDNFDEFLTGSWLSDTDVFCSPTVVPDADLPQYLGSVDEGGGHFRWSFEYSRVELEQMLQRKLSRVFAEDAQEPEGDGPAVLVADLPPQVVEARVPPIGQLTDLRVVARGPSGRAWRVEVSYLSPKGKACRIAIRSEYRIREALHPKFLFSSAFKVEIDRDQSGVLEKIRLRGAGWGHGAGLCQIGALGMAVKGYSCPQILKHYFEGVQLRALY